MCSLLTIHEDGRLPLRGNESTAERVVRGPGLGRALSFLPRQLRRYVVVGTAGEPVFDKYLNRMSMETMTIQLTHEKASDLMRDLEAMHIIRVIERNAQPTGTPSERFAGKLSEPTALAMQQHIIESRNEWNPNDS